VVDEGAARVVHVCHVPLDEEGEALGEGGVERHEMPLELDAVGTGAGHRERLASGPFCDGLEVVGAQTERGGRFTDLGQSSLSPRGGGAGCGLIGVDDRHELDVLAAERHDAIAGAVANVA
jgi:hypothetical protein